jgi:hypothetical protein
MTNSASYPIEWNNQVPHILSGNCSDFKILAEIGEHVYDKVTKCLSQATLIQNKCQDQNAQNKNFICCILKVKPHL